MKAYLVWITNWPTCPECIVWHTTRAKAGYKVFKALCEAWGDNQVKFDYIRMKRNKAYDGLGEEGELKEKSEVQLSK